MAGEVQVPSIFDYLGQGIQQGVQDYHQAKAENDRKDAEQANFMGSLLQSGAIDSDTFNANPLVQKMGVKVAPTTFEMKRKIAASPDVDPSSGKPWTPEQRSYAGLKPVEVQNAEIASAKTSLNLDDIKQRYAKGEDVNETEAAAIGLPTKETLQEGRQVAQSQYMSTVGKSYLDAALGPVQSANAGRIPTGGWQAIAGQAYDKFAADRAAHGLPPMPQAQSYFTTQLLDRYNEQVVNDAKMRAAQNAGRNSLDPTDRRIAAWTNIIESRRKQLDDLISGDKLLQFKLQDPGSAKDPNVLKFNAISKSIDDATNSQMLLAGGVVDRETAGLLGVGTAAPTNSPGPVGSSTPPKVQASGADVQGIIDAIKGKQASLSDAQKLVTAGKLTQSEFQQVQNAVSSPTKSGIATPTAAQLRAAKGTATAKHKADTANKVKQDLFGKP